MAKGVSAQREGQWPMPSLLTAVLMGALVYSYFTVDAEWLVYRVQEPADFLSRRLFGSLFAVRSQFDLGVQALFLLLLCVFAEARRGSVFFLADAVLKVVMINGLATGLFWCLAFFRGYEGIGAFLAVQAERPAHGLGFLLAAELSGDLLETARGPLGRFGHRLRLLAILCLLGGLCWAYYYRLSFLAAEVAGLATSLRPLNLRRLLAASRLLRAVDWRLNFARKVLFLHGRAEEAPLPAPPVPLERVAVRPEEEIPEGKPDDEETRSRHDDVNWRDYVRPAPAVPKPDAEESFEV